MQQMQQIQMQMQQQQFVQAAAPAVSQPPQYYIPNQSGYPQQQPQQQQGWN